MSLNNQKQAKTIFKVLGDAMGLAFCLWFSIFFASNATWEAEQSSAFNSSILFAIAVFLGLMLARGVYRVNARYIGLYDFLNLGVISLGTTCALAIFHFILPGTNLRINELLLFGFLLLTYVAGSRILLRLYSWRQLPFKWVPTGRPIVRTLIVGAGDAGEMMIREIQKAPENRRVVNAFVDDDPEKKSMILQGVRVMGTTNDVPTLVEQLGISEIILALPSADGPQMRRIVEICTKTNVKVRTLPSVSRLLDGKVGLNRQLRDVEIEDLLRREPAKVDSKRVAAYLNGESIMITGAGGSIGSELARQIASLAPGHLVLAGKGENSIFEIEQEILTTTPLEPTAVILDVRDQRRFEMIVRRHMPSVIFHAAAHKHVPLMQASPIEAIRNNVFGTKCAAETAIRNGVSRFVYISTDKAVNPTSVMGATKRVGEMIVMALAQRSETNFSVVRFGNVLGSRGSLIPVLKQQIARGGPVRVTHPDMTRYFMTIPEAVQLILQAGSSGSTGEVFILDMGEPVKIIDLAMDLIRLHGLTPEVDIPIKFIGIRPGEKIHEELVYDQEQLIPSDHPKISMAKSRLVDWDWLSNQLEALDAICNENDPDRARVFLMELAKGQAGYGIAEFPATNIEVS